jgi:flavin-dependent dehydrogenase
MQAADRNSHQQDVEAKEGPVGLDPGSTVWDVLVAGGGPAGAAAGLHAARLGLKTLVIEKDLHPRFHIGESMLPQASIAIQKLGLAAEVEALPQVAKYGGSFALGNETEFKDFDFEDSLTPDQPRTLNIERSVLDKALLDGASASGAQVMQNYRIRKIDHMETGRVELSLVSPEGTPLSVRGRHLLDATGQGTLVGHHLGNRRTLPDFKRIAFFNHFTGVKRRAGQKAGHPLIVMCKEGWFWLIAINETTTSIGFVMNSQDTKKLPVENAHALKWLIQRSPLVQQLAGEADASDTNGVTADFSYSCRPFAGPGFFLLGDAAAFIDPIFSTGVCMGLNSAIRAVDLVAEAEAGRCSWPAAYDQYARYVAGSSAPFFQLARMYYDHTFREMFLHGVGPLKMHLALISILTGNVFPRPSWAIRWRFELFKFFVRIHNYVPLVPRRPPFALLDEA